LVCVWMGLLAPAGALAAPGAGDPQVIATISVRGVPSGVGVNPATNRIYVGISDRIAVIDGATETVNKVITGVTAPTGVGGDPARDLVYVANGGRAGIVAVIDGATNAITATIPVGSYPQGVGVDPKTNRIYVASYSSYTVAVIDGATRTVIATVPVG